MSIREIEILLELQTALLGVITPNIRGITVGWTSDQIDIIAYYNGTISDDDKEDIEVVNTEMVAKFYPTKITSECIRIDYPENIRNKHLKKWVYFRKE